jgi:hypothetical protein
MDLQDCINEQHAKAFIVIREFANGTGYLTTGNAWSFESDRARHFESREAALAWQTEWRANDPHHVTFTRVVAA